MRGIRTLIRELWWYLTYDDYGRRRLRPAAYALLLPLGLAAAVFLWAFFQSRQAQMKNGKNGKNPGVYHVNGT